MLKYSQSVNKTAVCIVLCTTSCVEKNINIFWSSPYILPQFNLFSCQKIASLLSFIFFFCFALWFWLIFLPIHSCCGIHNICIFLILHKWNHKYLLPRASHCFEFCILPEVFSIFILIRMLIYFYIFNIILNVFVYSFLCFCS